jgi:acyl dehydratase
LRGARAASKQDRQYLSPRSEGSPVLYFEDFVIGQVHKTMGVTITEEAVIRFAMEYDYQPFHADKVAAKESMFGGLIASGLQTLAMTFRMCNQAQLFAGNALAGIGLDDVRFIKPVYAGDTIHAVVTIADRREAGKYPKAGIIKWDIKTMNQKDELVFKAMLTNIMMRRPEPTGTNG